MKNCHLFITLFLLSLFVIKLVYTDQLHDEDYIDPMDLFNFDPINMRMKKEADEVPPTDPPTTSDQTKDKSDSVAKDIFTQKTESCSLDTKLNMIAISLLRQYAMILVNNLEKKDISNTRSDINLRLRVSRHDIYKLKQFGQEKTTDIHDVHETLRSLIQFASDVLPPESHFYWLESRIGLSWPMMLQILATIICFMALLRVLQQTFITQCLIFQTLFLLFVISVVFAWIEMYQEKLADQERKLMEIFGEACQKPEDQSFWNRAFLFVTSQFTFKSDKCQEYYQIIFVNPLLKVSPMEAIAVSVVKTVVAPIGIIGKAISTFLTELLKDLPLHYQLAVSCALPLLIIIFLCIWRGYQLNLFHLVSIGPGHHPAPLPVGPGHHPAPLSVGPGHHSASVQLQHTTSTAIAPAPDSSQEHQNQPGSRYPVHDIQPNERVPQLSSVNLRSFNTTQRVTKQHNQLQQRSQAETQTELELTESDSIAREEPGPGRMSGQIGDDEDIRQRLAQVKITQAVELKQQEVENQLRKLAIHENQHMQTDTHSREISADDVIKESGDMKQSSEEKSMTKDLQGKKKPADNSDPTTAGYTTLESTIRESQTELKQISLESDQSNDCINLAYRRKNNTQESDTGVITQESDRREITQEAIIGDEDFVVVKEDDFVFQEVQLHIKMDI